MVTSQQTFKDMKHLHDFTQQATTQLLDSMGAFFAFSNEQFEQNRKEGTKYTKGIAGCLVPVENANELARRYGEIYSEAIKQDIKENGMAAIMQREFANYECQICGNYDDAKDALQCYGFSDEDFQKQWQIYWQRCVELDLF